MKVKLRFSAPSAGIAEIELRDPLSWRSSGGVLPGIEPSPSDSSGCKVRGLHHGATTPSHLSTEREILYGCN